MDTNLEDVEDKFVVMSHCLMQAAAICNIVTSTFDSPHFCHVITTFYT